MTLPDEKACPFCDETIKAAAIKCRYCGSTLVGPAHPSAIQVPPSSFSSLPPAAGQPYGPPVIGTPAPAKAHVFQIVGMWVLGLVSMTAGAANPTNPTAGLLPGLVSLAAAIFLVTQKATADKVNGWIVIVLNIIGLLFFLSVAASPQQSGM